jgi:EAL domain-containing protein (putative c-di-GMP-specific phosphodiesterase class I)/ActR/RegA family two-component response regulator
MPPLQLSAPGESMKMLIIDDEEDICDLIAELGERRGLEVKSINAAENVESLLAGFTPDIIMMDLMMPGTDGVELLRLLAERVRQAKICLISGSDARVLGSARRLGSAHGLDVVAALEKPLTIPVLNAFFDQVTSGQDKVKEISLADAIAAGQFTLHYQPVIELATRRVKGAEALARWQHPGKGLLLPDKFLEDVVNDGLMQALTDFVLRKAAEQLAYWRDANEDLTLSVNMTASTLLDLALPEKIADLCKQRNIDAGKLILEVTETEAMRDATRTMDVLLRLRIRNIGVSIDDFGIGHSSLQELQRMPFNEMKIDRSFVTDMVQNHDSAVIVKSIIDLGHNLGLKVIAEGIEDAKVWNLLRERGCDFAQGYYMGKPMPRAEFDAWLVNWRKAAI